MFLNMSTLLNTSDSGALKNSSCTATSTPQSQEALGMKLENQAVAMAYRSLHSLCIHVWPSCMHGHRSEIGVRIEADLSQFGRFPDMCCIAQFFCIIAVVKDITGANLTRLVTKGNTPS